MTKNLLFLLILVCIIAVAPLAIGEKGYILIALNNWTIEGTLVSFGVMLFISAVVIYLLYKLLHYIFSFYGKTKQQVTNRSEQKKLEILQQGLWASLSGDHATATKLLLKSKAPQGWQGLSQAIAAKAALAQGNRSQALDLLNDLDEQDQKNAAQLFVESEQADTAALLLAPVANKRKTTSVELRQYSQLLVQQQNWDELEELLPKLEKKQALNADEWQQLLLQYFDDMNSDVLKSRFAHLSRALKHDAKLIYIQAMLKTGDITDVEPTLMKMLKQQDLEQLLDVLKVNAHFQCQQLEIALQKALKKQPDQSELLLCLAYVAKAQQDYQLAAKIFKQELNEHNQQQHWQAAVACFNQQGETESALALYQQYS